MPLKFAILAGEASGDAHGARLAHAIRHLIPDALFQGVGGPQMRAAGVDLLYDSARWGAIGVVESLRLVRPLTRAKDDLVARFKEIRPDLLIPIDFGYFNVRAAHPLRKAGVRILYYMPPRSWDPGAHVSEHLSESVDGVAAPFPWSAAAFRECGVEAHFVGHPLLDMVNEDPDRERLLREIELPSGQPIMALLPGSRRHEVSFLWPRLCMAAAIVAERVPGTRFVTPVAATMDQGALEKTARQILENRRGEKNQVPEIRFLAGRTGDALSLADAVATCSGTATLEAAIRMKPLVALYGGSWWMELEWRLRRPKLQLRFISLPNIIAGEKIVEELIQHDASPARIADEVVPFLTDPERSRSARSQLAAVRDRLGDPGAVDRAARIAISMARGEPASCREEIGLPLDGGLEAGADRTLTASVSRERA